MEVEISDENIDQMKYNGFNFYDVKREDLDGMDKNVVVQGAVHFVHDDSQYFEHFLAIDDSEWRIVI